MTGRARLVLRLCLLVIGGATALGAMADDASSWAIYNCTSHDFTGEVLETGWKSGGADLRRQTCDQDSATKCHYSHSACAPSPNKRTTPITISLKQGFHNFGCPIPVLAGGWIEIHENDAAAYGLQGVFHSQLWCRSLFDQDGDTGTTNDVVVHNIYPQSAASTVTRKVRFLATADLHYGNGDHDPRRTQINHTVDSMLGVLKQGGVDGIVLVGDTTEGTRAYGEWEGNYQDSRDSYKERIAGFEHFFFEGLGNHDNSEGDAGSQPLCTGKFIGCIDKDYIVEDIVTRYRTGTLNYDRASFFTGEWNTHRYNWGTEVLDTKNPHYSWDWHDVHFVQLNLKPSDEATSKWDNPMNALTFLKRDLAAHVRDSGRPVVIFHHLDVSPQGLARMKPAGNPDFTDQEITDYWETIAPYNVIGLYVGHLHATGSPDPTQACYSLLDDDEEGYPNGKYRDNPQKALFFPNCNFPFGTAWKGQLGRPAGSSTGPSSVDWYYAGPGYGDAQQEFAMYLDVTIDGSCSPAPGHACLTTKQMTALYPHAPRDRQSHTKEFRVDFSPPATIATLPDGVKDGQWVNAATVEVSLTATDQGRPVDGGTSGVKTVTHCVGLQPCVTTLGDTATASISTEGETVVSYWSSDKAGSVEPTKTVTVRIDRTKPIIDATLSPAPVSGWNNSDVTVSFSCTDRLSGIATNTLQDLVVREEGQNKTVTGVGSCKDRAGNEATPTATISLDKTPPTITLASRTPVTKTTWNNNDVTVTWNCKDSLSTASTDTVSATLKTENTSATQAQSATGKCTDKAGNTSTNTVSDINIDKTPPTIGFFSRTPPTGGIWNNNDVTVTWTCKDSLSGSEAPVLSTTVSTENTSAIEPQSATGHCSDNAGNTTAQTVGDINIDKTSPTIELVHRTSSNGNGWNNEDVTLVWKCIDALSQPEASEVSTTVKSENTSATVAQSATGRCSDVARNTSTATKSDIFIDKSPPIPLPPEITGSEGDNGWFRSDVKVHLRCTDAVSGVSLQRYHINRGPTVGYTDPFSLTTEGTHKVGGDCIDKADNIATMKEFDIRIDKTKPTIVLVKGPAAGWSAADVTLKWECSDETSGVVTPTVEKTVSFEGNSTVTAECRDLAGHSLADTVIVKIDKTLPVITYRGSTPDQPTLWGYRTDVTFRWTCSDLLSGVASPTASATLTEEKTDQRATGLCTDNAGNVSTNSRTGVNIDKTVPVAVIDPYPFPFAFNNVVTGSATDNLSGVETVLVRFWSASGQPIERLATCISACSTSSIRWSVSTAGLPPDYYRISATPTDRAGNRGTDSPTQVLFIM